MSIPTGDHAFLHKLELNIRAELTEAETSPPEEEAIGVPIGEWLFDPEDTQRYEAGLHSLLSAVEAMEHRSDPGDHPPSAESPDSVNPAESSVGGPPVHRAGKLVKDAGRTPEHS